MAHSVNHLEEKIAIAKLIQEAISKVVLPEGYVIDNNTSVIIYKPQKLVTHMVYLNRNTKGEYDTSINFQ